jgi:hypothetical protein
MKSAHVEREESEDVFMWMGANVRRKHTIRVLAADWSNDRRCGSIPSYVQLCVCWDNFFVSTVLNTKNKLYFFITVKIIS